MAAETSPDVQKKMLELLSAIVRLTNTQPHVCTTQSLQSANQQRVTQIVAANANAMADPGPLPLTNFPGQLPVLPAGV